uniref:Uncharacterized protein n=1 Tax=Arundo donax TaxID=35708 RepID=A0A0A9FA57_ARUDO
MGSMNRCKKYNWIDNHKFIFYFQNIFTTLVHRYTLRPDHAVTVEATLRLTSFEVLLSCIAVLIRTCSLFPHTLALCGFSFFSHNFCRSTGCFFLPFLYNLRREKEQVIWLPISRVTWTQIFLPSQISRIDVQFRHLYRIPSVIYRVLEKFVKSDICTRVRHLHPCPYNTAH